jgi:hypothetical protein
MSTRKTIVKILKESLGEFDWINNHEVDPLMVGTRIFIGDDSTNRNNKIREFIKNRYLILEIIFNDGVDLDYHVHQVSLGNESSNNSIGLAFAQNLLAEGYWRVLSPDIPDYLLEDDESIKLNDFTPYIISFVKE